MNHAIGCYYTVAVCAAEVGRRTSEVGDILLSECCTEIKLYSCRVAVLGS